MPASPQGPSLIVAADTSSDPSHDRLDGWKAIAKYFGRDRTTVIRWAGERGLPVRSLPGGKSRTVYALVSELDDWTRREEPAGANPGPTLPPPQTAPARPLRFVAAGGVAIVLAVAAVGWRHHPVVDQSSALPRDPAVAEIFVQARADWAQRSRDSLAEAITGFTTTTRREPGFAPAFADLADAYLLEGEAGSLSSDIAFARAESAARAAQARDPTLPAALRALGFIAYWRDADRASTRRMFTGALSAAPDDAQTLFWYANILADNGEDAAAMRAFARARLLDPGSPAVEADYAWALWSAGRTAEARTRLASVLRDHPDDAETLDCTAMVALVDGRDAEFLRAVTTHARVRGEAALATQAAALSAAYAKHGRAALLATAIRSERIALHPDRPLVALYASLAGDRATLAAVLIEADRRGERWGEAGYVRRVASRWRFDDEITRALRRRAGQRIDDGTA